MANSASRPRHILRSLFIVLLIGGAGYFGWRYFASRGALPAASTGDKGQQTASAIPVTMTPVQISDFAVYLNSLGTVQPYDTVTVRSRVDGEVMKVNFKQGQMVKEGDVLIQIDPRPYQAALDQATAKKAQDEATLKNAQLDLTRYTSLAKEDFASRQQADTQRALVDQLQAQIKGDQAAIDTAKTQLDYATIHAPLTGRTGFRLVDPGNVVHASDQTGIVSIVKLQPISVVFTAPEEELPQINKALSEGNVPVDALSSDGLKTLAHGRLALINNEVDVTSGTIGMKATFQNKDNALWPGLSVATSLLVETLKQVLVVPSDVIQRGPNGLYAFVIGAGNKAEIHNVKVAQEGHGLSVVSEGLSAGQAVVVSGQYRLQQGSVVQASPSAPQQTQVTQSASAKDE